MTFIYDVAGWPAFRWNAAAMGERLARVRYAQGRLAGRLEGLGPALSQQVSLETLTLEVVKSSEIEGQFANPNKIRTALAQGLGSPFASPACAHDFVEGMVQVALDVTQHHTEALSPQRMDAWHAALYPRGKDGARSAPGTWRTDAGGPVEGAAHLPAARISGEIHTLADWFERARESIDPVVTAGVAHLWLFTIQPFEEGNGPIARALADLALAHCEKIPQRVYCLSAQILRHQNSYRQIVEAARRGLLDITPWLEWFLEAFARALEDAQSIFEPVMLHARFRELHAAKPFNPRQQAFVQRLLQCHDDKLTTSGWATVAGCSQDTALRDIEDLVRRGVLLRDTAGGRSTTYSVCKT